MQISVTGGTGTLGRPLVDALTAAGHRVRVLTRRSRTDVTAPVEWVTGDLATGDGLGNLVAGADAIVHAATGARMRKVDIEGTNRLIQAAREAGTNPHVLYISIVGVDRVPFAYYKAKHEAEVLIEESGLPWTLLRATQFHDLLYMGLERLTRLPVVPLPRNFRFQPVDAGEVAERLADLALGEPVGRATDMGGPKALTIEELTRSLLRARGRSRRLVHVPLPGAAARGFRAGWHLTPEHADGTRTWEQFLADRVR